MIQKQLFAQIDSIKKQLIEKYQAEKIILFGSAAKGKFTPNSDLDFLVVKKDPRNFHDRIVTLYTLVNKDVAADFIVYSPEELAEKVRLGDPFIKKILLEGKVLYG